ncbi:MAG: hypothetical protein ACI4I5_06190 [Acutalibacteraceae bacterium]
MVYLWKSRLPVCAVHGFPEGDFGVRQGIICRAAGKIKSMSNIFCKLFIEKNVIVEYNGVNVEKARLQHEYG